MKKSSLVWGLIFILVGLLLVLNRLNILEINIFFSGWWTLFIIIPSIIGLINDKDKIGDLIGLVVGICLLLVMQEVIEFDTLMKLFFPIIIIIIGVGLIFKDGFNKKVQKEVKNIKNKDGHRNEYNAIFSGQDYNFKDNSVGNMELLALFGGIKLDLREAKIPNDMLIEASSIFGGIEILVPEGVAVKTTGTSIFGGITNKHEDSSAKKTIYIENLCLFGGLDIK